MSLLLPKVFYAGLDRYQLDIRRLGSSRLCGACCVAAATVVAAVAAVALAAVQTYAPASVPTSASASRIYRR